MIVLISIDYYAYEEKDGYINKYNANYTFVNENELIEQTEKNKDRYDEKSS